MFSSATISILSLSLITEPDEADVLCIFDTAGLRSAENPVEREGIRRTSEIIDTSDMVLYVVDGVVGIHEEDRAFLARLNSRAIPVWNKIDIADREPPEGFVGLSTITGKGFSALERRIIGRLSSQDLVPISGSESAIIDSERQKECLDSALQALHLVRQGIETNMPLDAIATDLREALNALGELTGEVTSGDILEVMFSRFCVGK